MLYKCMLYNTHICVKITINRCVIFLIRQFVFNYKLIICIIFLTQNDEKLTTYIFFLAGGHDIFCHNVTDKVARYQLVFKLFTFPVFID